MITKEGFLIFTSLNLVYMFKETPTQKLVEYLQTLPEKDKQVIVKTLSSPKPKKKLNEKDKRKQQVLKSISAGLHEIKESKRTGKPLKTLDEFLNEF